MRQKFEFFLVRLYNLKITKHKEKVVGLDCPTQKVTGVRKPHILQFNLRSSIGTFSDVQKF